MIKDLIKWSPLLIGIVIVIALYFISNFLSVVNILLPDFLLTAIAVGFMVGGKIKDGAINGALFVAIGGVIITLVMLAMYAMGGYIAYLGYIAFSLVISLDLEIVIATIGGLLGSLVKIESGKESSPST